MRGNCDDRRVRADGMEGQEMEKRFVVGKRRPCVYRIFVDDMSTVV